jgi:hypothetical protein
MKQVALPAAAAGVVTMAIGAVSARLGFDWETWQFWLITAPVCFVVGYQIGKSWTRP